MIEKGMTVSGMGLGPDRRSWWQRHAPLWLGGKPDVRGYGSAIIVEVITGQTPCRDG